MDTLSAIAKLADVVNGGKKKKGPAAYRVIGTLKQPHVFGSLVGLPGARGLIRKIGINNAMNLFPALGQAKVMEVDMTVLTHLDDKRYNGAKLRDLRAQYGVGRRVHV